MHKYATFHPQGATTDITDVRLCRFDTEAERHAVTYDPELGQFFRTISKTRARWAFPEAFDVLQGTVSYDYETFERELEDHDGENLWIVSPDMCLACWTGYHV